MTENNNVATTTEEQTPAQNAPVANKPEVPNHERFANLVLKQAATTGLVHFTDKEKRLIQGYYMVIDQMLCNAEAERVAKNAKNSDHRYDKTVPCDWKHVDLVSLANDLARYAKIGLDMNVRNTLFAIPYLDKSGQYTVTLMPGYNGIRYEAQKYAVVPFKDVIVEVVYSNDRFKVLKKDVNHPIESYEFDVENPFDRGTPVGVFGYIIYDDQSMNKLVVFSTADVEKRKPKTASAAFWGGTKVSYENGKRVETEVDGWLAEMYEKTMKREIYSDKHMPRDPGKMDEAMKYVEEREKQYREIIVDSEIVEKANSQELAVPDTHTIVYSATVPSAAATVGNDIPTPEPRF